MTTATKSTACAECIAEGLGALWCSCAPDTRVFWAIECTFARKTIEVLRYTRYLPGEDIPANVSCVQEKDLTTSVELAGLARGCDTFEIITEEGEAPRLRPLMGE